MAAHDDIGELLSPAGGPLTLKELAESLCDDIAPIAAPKASSEPGKEPADRALGNRLPGELVRGRGHTIEACAE